MSRLAPDPPAEAAPGLSPPHAPAPAERAPAAAPDQRAAPGYYYGWVMLPLATLLQIGTIPGQTFGVAVFNPSIRESLGLSHSGLSTCYLVACLLAATPLTTIGALMDRYGLRRVTLGVVALVGLGCVATSQAVGVVSLTAGFFLLRAFGQGALSLAASNTLAMWFERRLGFVSGCLGAGMAGGIAVMPALYLYSINQIGWRATYAAIGVATWLVILPLFVWLYRNQPSDVGQRIDGGPSEDDSTAHAKPPAGPSFTLREAMRTRAYWIALAVTAMYGMVATGLFFNLVPLFEWRGLSAEAAAGSMAVFAGAMAYMQLQGGWLADRAPLHYLVSGCMAFQLLGVLALITTGGWLGSLAFALALGVGQGMLAAFGNTLWARYFGRAALGKIRSSVWTTNIAACPLGPVILSASYDGTGSFSLGLGVFAALLACAAGAGLLATRPAPPL
ncbi:Major Facilitator Superfamily protein [Pseudobythopirellula maris]|uniref:Major Facilitator Superfamily protein n=1 Tax=Pseudobythopirellula maris TaxID=2527991 RepID=A0A5C5ZPI0_9BACT|nr:MFS transporter [Pseudobythopirellula maris]TWT89025.1 Major Facilitator Superfamily protein [Pseudobythopirellula maris]